MNTGTLLTLAQSSSGDAGPAMVVLLIELAILVLVVAGMWKTFAKAGEPGWAAIVPIFNTYILLKIAGKPWWWLLLLFIPFVNFILLLLVMLDLAKAFGKSAAFGIGLWLLAPIFICILGFGSAQYQGPRAA